MACTEFQVFFADVFIDSKKLATQNVYDLWAGVPGSAALHRDTLFLLYFIKKGPFFLRRSFQYVPCAIVPDSASLHRDKLLHRHFDTKKAPSF